MGTDKAEDAKTDSSLTEGFYLLVLLLNAGLPLCEYADFNLCLPISYAGATYFSSLSGYCLLLRDKRP